jgi:PLP dependent protein
MYDERLKRVLEPVRQRMDAARARSGRADEVRLIAVTKGHPLAAIEAAWRAGIADIGENRVQELDEKRSAFAGGADGPRWHLIGHLQRNKVRRALVLCDMIHSVDSLRLARELSKEAQRAGREVRALVQVNVSGETTKGGFDVRASLADIAEAGQLPGLSIEGLMTMAPWTEDESIIRDTFARTRQLLDRCAAEGVALRGRELSMGMSADFEIAIEEGSTMIRLGTTLFGEREQ